MEARKTPFNWVGNKFKYIDVINNLVRNKNYNSVIDMFMGSGNILLNINTNANKMIGNDKIKLLPCIYTEIEKNKHMYTLEDVDIILNRLNRFSKKEDYYIFRDYWNEKYLNDKMDEDFIIETVLLLKMCSNSMVRFNQKEGYFNQGFRGLGKKDEFFTESMKRLCVDSVNSLTEILNKKEFDFTSEDFLNFKDSDDNNLIILDPPYILRSDMYTVDWNKEHEDKLNKLIMNTKNDFIYFNYLERDGIVNQELVDIIKKRGLTVIEINNKTNAGQGRSKNTIEVKEVLITNI